MCPQQQPQRDDLDALMSEVLDASLSRAQSRAPASTPAPAAPTPPPASSAGHPRPLKWDPPTLRETSPRELLAIVADNAFAMQRKIEALVEAITGEQPAQRSIRPVPNGNGLLPVLSHLAHEIDVAHSDVARLVDYLHERVS